MFASKKDALTLSACADAAPVIAMCLQSRTEEFMTVALAFGLTLLAGFAQMISDTCNRGAAVGVDLTAEDRREKCLAAKAALLELCPILEACTTKTRNIQRQVGELLSRIHSL
jgi:hypothetical protein